MSSNVYLQFLERSSFVSNVLLQYHMEREIKLVSTSLFIHGSGFLRVFFLGPLLAEEIEISVN